MNDPFPQLLTTAELAVALRKSAYTIRKWKREGKIPAEADTGTLLFDQEKVRKKLAADAKAKANSRKRGPNTTPGMVPTIPAS